MSSIAKHTPGTPAWFDLMTSDASSARGFYQRLFGWRCEVGGPETGSYTMCKLGERNAAGLGQMQPDAPFPPSWTVYFAVEDADAALATIREAGGQVMMGPMDVMDEGRMGIAMDPTGAVFGLWQPKNHAGASVVGEPGAMVWCEVATRAPEQARPFYERVFGLEARRLEAPGMAYYTLHKGEATVAGIMGMDEHWGELPPHWMPYFQVADTDATCALVMELGGEVHRGPFDSGYGRMAVVSDPQGAVFTVIRMAS